MSTPTSAAARAGSTDAPPASNPPAFYRHDLDGLRGVAIAMVAVFHVWFGRVSGGVDVFLVLSGFFFGGAVLRSALNPDKSLSLAPQLTRLVRRLLPALVVVLAFSGLLTVLIQPETRWEAFADQSLASLGYFQNWELAGTASDYLRASEAVSPLQHIWSMSVQGQFYIAFLLFVFGLAALFRRAASRGVSPRALRRTLIVVLTTLTIASFVFAIFAHEANQATAYYNSFARAWELLLGALVGAVVPYVRWPMWLRTAAATVGLVAILACGWLIDGVREFPGPWALVPVVATALLVLAAANRQSDPESGDALPLPNRLLATAPCVALGAMAYSLYLWHWPLLIFWMSYTGHTSVSFVEGAVILLVSGVLAHLTTKFVENPLRHRSTSPRPQRVPLRVRYRRPTIALGTTVALLGVALTATSFTWREHVIVQRAKAGDLMALSPRDYPGAHALLNAARVPKLPMRPSVLEARADLPATTNDGCISDFSNIAIINCTYGDPTATRTIALAGGSHAEHWIPALDLLGKQHNFKVVTYLKMGCPLSSDPNPLIVGDNLPYPQCRKWVERVTDRLLVEHPDYVFTNSTRPRFDSRGESEGDEVPRGYLDIWKKLSRNGIRVLGVRDTPWITRDGEPYIPADCLASGGDAESCGMNRADVLDDRNPTLNYVGQVPTLHPLDMSDAVCGPSTCRVVEGNVLIYHDSHHLSATYVRTMTEELGRQIAAATGWW